MIQFFGTRCRHCLQLMIHTKMICQGLTDDGQSYWYKPSDPVISGEDHYPECQHEVEQYAVDPPEIFQ